MSKNIKIILMILLIGVLYRLVLTSNGNFLFNMDNARDMVDIREMVILKKPRLIAHTSSIAGVFYGPAWYYLSSIPFLITGGNPYGSIVLLIFLWAIGGFFLLKLISRFGKFWILIAGFLWIASNIVGFATFYAFNPNPMILLTPLFIYLIEKYLNTNSLLYSSLVWFLGGLFFNFQMNFSMFIPFIILTIVLLSNPSLLKSKNFWIGSLFFIITLLPQIIFDIKHQFIMTKSLIRFLTTPSEESLFKTPMERIPYVSKQFYDILSSTFMNSKLLTNILIVLTLVVSLRISKKTKKDLLILIPLFFILIPMIFFILIPVTIASWHISAVSTTAILLSLVILKGIFDINPLGKIFSIILAFYMIFLSFLNIVDSSKAKPSSQDPSLYRNEIVVIDYVYKYANGQNFKVYTYLPSVYDYPYQYLFWWYGKKKYGYIPGEYVYSPNKPPYIPSQEKFQGRKDNLSKLMFLIKEPDRNYTRAGWEGEFVSLETVEKQMIGPLEIEIKREFP